MRLTESQLREIVKESVERILDESIAITSPIKQILGDERFPASDELFDLNAIPMEVLDNGWQRYHPYLFSIDHRNPFSNYLVTEGTDYKKQILEVKKAILETFPISEEQFKIINGAHGLYAAILVALTDDNVDVIENAMEQKGFSRSQPTDVNLLYDRKNRKWIDIRFEPKAPDDVTAEVHRKYNVLYHFTPSVNENEILEHGLLVSNNNPRYRYSEERAFLSEGDCSDEDKLKLVNALYAQAQERHIPNLTTEYTIFTFDLTKMDNSFRFFYDINEPKGLYTKTPIPQTFIIKIDHISAESTDKLP